MTEQLNWMINNHCFFKFAFEISQRTLETPVVLPQEEWSTRSSVSGPGGPFRRADRLSTPPATERSLLLSIVPRWVVTTLRSTGLYNCMDKRTEEWSQNDRFLDQIIADPRVREILFHHVLCCLVYLEAKRSRGAKGEERCWGTGIPWMEPGPWGLQLGRKGAEE